MRSEQHVVVLGAGVVGMATALTLVDRGHRVTLIDAAHGPGLGTSHANGAQLSYAYTDALASPATLALLPRLLFTANPALRISPRFDLDFARWGLAFLRNAGADRFLRNTLAGLELGLASRIALHAMMERHGFGFAHRRPGKIHLYRSAHSFAAARRLAEVKRRHGAVQHVLGIDEAVGIEPMLEPVRNAIVGALHTPEDEVGDPHLFCEGARAALIASGRGEARFDTRASAIIAHARRPATITARGERIESDRIVLCTGVDAAALARTVGARLPIQPMKGYSITCPPGTAAPNVSVTDVANRVVFARLGNRMRIAGLADLGARDTRIEPRPLARLKASARTALPDAADYDGADSGWAGLRPATPDSLPITRAIAPGVFANAGHGSLGWTYAAGSAERVADLIEARN